MEKIRIRKISWMDWRKLTALFQGIFPKLTTKEISHYIRHYEDTIAVAEARAGLVGFYQFTPRADEGTAWLNYLGVIPSHYRSGVAAQLLCEYEERATRMGFRLAEFDVLQQNQRAIRFYEKHGYARLHPVDNKFRYRKTLTVNVHAAGDPQPARTRPYPARLGRRVLYLTLVSLSLWWWCD